jgi:RND family efflux transporter MFP subunit
VAPEIEQEKLRALQSAEAAWEMAQAQIATKKAKLAAAQTDQQVARSKVEVARAEADHVRQLIELATIRAPFHGVISRRWVDCGATIKDAGMPLLTVMNTDQVRVLLEVPEAEVARIGELVEPKDTALRHSFELRFAALSGQPGGGVFHGSIARISGTLDPASRTMRAEIILDNSTGQLRPGMRGCAVLREEPSPEVPIQRTSRSR